MTSRREFLKAGTIAAAGLSAHWGCGKVEPPPTELPRVVTKFLDPLPLPQVLRPIGTRNGMPHYAVRISEFLQQLHSEFPETWVWGYASTYPGPTFEVRSGQPILVEWINGLPGGNRHLLDAAYDTHLHGTDSGEPRARTVVHLHGGHVTHDSDGYPTAWVNPGASALFTYPNRQPATTLWYHDHVLGITRLNVYAGLASFYIIRDAAEDALGLPRT